jgi:hypothetical protein
MLLLLATVGAATAGVRAASATTAAGAHDATAATSRSAIALVRYPSIWLRTTTSTLITWETDLPSRGKILFGETANFGRQQSDAPSGTEHSVPLTGLNPDTRYYYRVVSGEDTLTPGTDWFRTAPSETKPFRFLAFGDLGVATPEQIRVAARIDSLNADLAILTGDIVYDNGEASNFTPAFFDIYKPTIARIPFYPSLGNHDVRTLGGQPYLDAFTLPNNNPEKTERYYSFDYSNAHFVALDVTAASRAPSTAMLAWLDADLAATKQLWKFVFFHIPMYSNPGAHGEAPMVTAALEPILNAHGVDMVFQGHNHYYTRSYPIAAGAVTHADQEPAYLNPGGTIYVVTGGAGRVLYSLAPPTSHEVISKSTNHVTVIDVSGNTLSLRAVAAEGTVFDSMTLTKDLPTLRVQRP